MCYVTKRSYSSKFYVWMLKSPLYIDIIMRKDLDKTLDKPEVINIFTYYVSIIDIIFFMLAV